MASYRVMLKTSAYPGVARGAIVQGDPHDEVIAARVANGVLQAVDSTPAPDPLPFGSPEAPEPAEASGKGRGRRGRHDAPESDDNAAEAPVVADGDGDGDQPVDATLEDS